jgi:ABC-2 type transport system permease protein
VGAIAGRREDSTSTCGLVPPGLGSCRERRQPFAEPDSAGRERKAARGVSTFAHQLRTEQLVFWRSREAAVFIFVFPPLLYVLLGSVYNDTIEGRPAADVLLAGLLGYGIANTAFAGLAIQLVIRRESGVLKRLRATPLPRWTYLVAVLASTLLVFLLQTVTIFALGRVFFDAKLPSEWLSLALAIVLGVACFAGIGLGAAALIRSAEGSSAVVNVVLLPMAFLSGSFGPTTDYPEVLKAIGDVLPLKYLVDIVEAIYLDDEHLWQQAGAIAAVAAWGALGLLVAWRRFTWEPRER